MKTFFFILLLSVVQTTGFAQEAPDEKFEKACACIEQIDLGLERTEQFDEVEECIENAITSDQLISKLQAVLKQSKKDSIADIGEPSKKREYNVTIDNREGYKKLEEKLLRNCPSMKRVMTTNNDVSEVSITDKESAKKAYDKGMEVYRKQDFAKAKGFFKKAVRKDPNFAWAWDMLGITFRSLEDYDKAIEAYDKSIRLDPNGRMPLMNKPIAYALKGDNENAIKNYKVFIHTFPDDPEGYYGIGRIYLITKEYGLALDSTMKAYLMYKEIKSPYALDAERNLAIIYNDLKDQNKLHIWEKYSKIYNIQIGE